MRARHARRIRRGLTAARFEAARGWRVMLDLSDPLAGLALQRERRRLFEAEPRGRRSHGMVIDWPGRTRRADS